MPEIIDLIVTVSSKTKLKKLTLSFPNETSLCLNFVCFKIVVQIQNQFCNENGLNVFV
jgi:hypothetical protein